MVEVDDVVFEVGMGRIREGEEEIRVFFRSERGNVIFVKGFVVRIVITTAAV